MTTTTATRIVKLALVAGWVAAMVWAAGPMILVAAPVVYLLCR